MRLTKIDVAEGPFGDGSPFAFPWGTPGIHLPLSRLGTRNSDDNRFKDWGSNPVAPDIRVGGAASVPDGAGGGLSSTASVRLAGVPGGGMISMVALSALPVPSQRTKRDVLRFA
jgi:hypothetical protein